PGRLALAPRPFGDRTELLLFAWFLFTRILAVRRGVFDFGIEFGADQDRERRYVEPEHGHDHAADRAVGRVVRPEIGDVELEPERDEHPEHRRENGPGRDPNPLLLGVG